MSANLITSLQLFSIGFSFGIAGPCLFSCTPIIITYLCATKKKWFATFTDICIFLLGRFMAYLVLGFLTGLSAGLLKQFIDSRFTQFLRFSGGVITILLGISLFFLKEQNSFWCKLSQTKTTSRTGLFILGFIIGVSPCLPLVTLLTEIALIAKTALGGVWYAFSFGCGIFLSSFLVLASLGGIFIWIPKKIVKSKTSEIIFKIICSSLLIIFGINIMMKTSLLVK
ncbi:MAG: sulfite exporter TauE/SafE family protein [Candidatus Omnitrophota bacterium]|nr:sulfite exporter TauE/SafE family protein [Candidatus Omnitrophota bacterium]